MASFNLPDRHLNLTVKTGLMKSKPARAERQMEGILTFAEFKTILRGSESIAEQSLRKSYRALNKLRKGKQLSWPDTREKLNALIATLQVEILKSKGKLKAGRIPLTKREWERL